MQVGLHPPGLNPAVAPVGGPEADSATFWVAPALNVAVIVVTPVFPGVTEMVPEFESPWTQRFRHH